MIYEFSINSANDMFTLGKKTAIALNGGAFLALRGTLGAGKTVFVQGLAQGLGITERIVSPTFTLLNTYNGSRPLYHFDLYRVDEDQCRDLGFDDYFFDTNAVCAVEWSERLSVLPANSIVVSITTLSDTSRKVTFELAVGILNEEKL